MNILILSETGYGAWFSWLFEFEDHSVDLVVVKEKYRNILEGLVSTPLVEIPEIEDLKKYDLVIFDMTGNGKIASEISKYTNVIGDSLLADELEDNRQYGIEVMEEVEINVPTWESFSNLKSAAAYIRRNPKRYVFKPSGDDQDTAATYVAKDAEDLLKYIAKLETSIKGSEFILQEFVEGTEVSTEGFFNGTEWFFVNCTLEEKKFMNDGLGPNTGCAGNLVFSHAGMDKTKIFRQGLAKLTDFLQEQNYRGMIDLNTIVTDSNLYGLEFTPRFGYDATATQTLLINGSYASFLHAIASGQKPILDYARSNCYSASVRLSIPPYPLISKMESVYQKDVPIQGLNEPEQLKNFYLYDAYLKGTDLLTAGHEGFIGCPLEYSNDPRSSFDIVYDRIKTLKIPNLQYRTDLKDKIYGRYSNLLKHGWFSKTEEAITRGNTT